MRKFLLITAAALITAQTGFAQYLYGMSMVGNIERSLVRFDPATNTFSTLLKTFNYYQPITTKDTVLKRMYFMAPAPLVGGIYDTVVTVRLADTSVTKVHITKGSLPFPTFANGKLISASAQGMASYDLATNQHSIIDNNVKITGLHSADFDHTRGRYICMKRAGNSATPDTLFVYTMATRVLTTHVMGVTGTSQEMAYSPKDDKIVFLGSIPNSASFGLFTYHLASRQLNFESALPTAGGVFVNCATFDQTGNRYFFVRPTNTSGTTFNVLEYRLNTSTVVDHLVGTPGIGFPQYFDHLRITAPGGTSVGFMNTEEPFKMYPNPAANQLNVHIDLAGRTAALRITDLTGKVVLVQDKAAAENQVNISSLPNGKYVLSIAFEDKVYSRLFVKAN